MCAELELNLHSGRRGYVLKKLESVAFKGEINRGLRSTEKRKFLVKC
jgi:hypothetical protein